MYPPEIEAIFTLITAQLNDNITGDITPGRVRAVLGTLVDTMARMDDKLARDIQTDFNQLRTLIEKAVSRAPDYVPGSFVKGQFVASAGKLFIAKQAIENSLVAPVATDAYWLQIGANSDLIATVLNPVTYEELRELIAAEALAPASWYLLQDYQTTHLIPGTTELVVGDIEPLLLLASSRNTLSDVAYSTVYPQDKLRYVAANQENILPGCSKGYIIRRIDLEYNNDVCFDFRVVKFRRYQDASGNYSFGYDPVGNLAYQDFYAFDEDSYQSGNIRNNSFELSGGFSPFDNYNFCFGGDAFVFENSFQAGCSLLYFTAFYNSGMQYTIARQNSSISAVSLLNNSGFYNISLAGRSQISSLDVQNCYMMNVFMENAIFIAVQCLSDNISDLLLTAGAHIYYLTGGISGAKLIRATLFSPPAGIHNCMFINCLSPDFSAGTSELTFIDNVAISARETLLKAPNGSSFKVQVSDDGTLFTKLL